MNLSGLKIPKLSRASMQKNYSVLESGVLINYNFRDLFKYFLFIVRKFNLIHFILLKGALQEENLWLNVCLFIFLLCGFKELISPCRNINCC